MSYRTDLALERKQLYDEERGYDSDIDGIEIAKIHYADDVKATRIKILDERGEKALEKPTGSYITLEIEGLTEEIEGIKERAAAALAAELGNLIQFHNSLKALVIGLGNDKVTPDSLGPYTVAKVKITRHIFLMSGEGSDESMSCVSGFIPGVTGSTGMETAELIEKAVQISNPDVIIVIDALAARDISRISTTIQINDTGISPGGGMGNQRKEISEKTMGKRVVAIGVPTVIDSRTLITDTLRKAAANLVEIEEYVAREGKDMIVTSTDIDSIIKEFSDVIANGINITLHPGIYLAENSIC